MQGFLHCVWSPRMPYSVAEKGGGEKKKKKKSRQKKSATPLGISSEDGMPQQIKVTYRKYIKSIQYIFFI